MKREYYEWTRTWVSNAPDPQARRVLLVGDSITGGYEPFVRELLEGLVFVDMIASSTSLDDPRFMEELMRMSNGEYRYELIHFNNGLHGMHMSAEEYTERLKDCVERLMPVAPLVLALSTPISVGGLKAEPEPLMNAKVVARNAGMAALATEKGLPLNDLYTPMLGHDEYRAHCDGYHYNDTGKKLQAGLVANSIRKVIA